MSSNISSGNSSLREMFQGSMLYVLPAYQRPYSWFWEDAKKKNQREASWGPSQIMMEDLLVQYQSVVDKVTEFQRYLLGPVAYWPDRSRGYPVRVLVDGQQRFTTALLFFSALRSVIHEWEPNHLFNFDALLVSHGDDGVARTRIEATGRLDCQEILDTLLLRGENPNPKINLRGNAQNILKTWRRMREWIQVNFSGDERVVEVMSFAKWVLDDGLVLSCGLPSEEMAVVYFRNANGRGLPMSEPHHVRCVFYEGLSAEETTQMDALWDAVTGHIADAYDSHGGPKATDQLQQFLDYFMMSHTQSKLRASGGRRGAGALRFALKGLLNEPKSGNAKGKHRIAMMKKIAAAASAFRHIVKGRNPKGNHSPATETFPRLSGATSIHKIALLGIHRLPEALYEKVAAEICEWLFVAQVSGIHQSKNEEVCHRIAAMFREKGWDETSAREAIAFLYAEKRKHGLAFRAELEKASNNLSPNKIRRHLLLFGIIEEKIRKDVGQLGKFHRADYLPTLSQVNRNGDERSNARREYHLDHVQPQALCRGTSMEPDMHALGNLVVLAASPNSSLRDLPFEHEDKRNEYRNNLTGNLLVGMMVNEDTVKGNGQHAEAIRHARAMGLGPYATMGKEEIGQRTRALVDMAASAMGLPSRAEADTTEDNRDNNKDTPVPWAA